MRTWWQNWIHRPCREHTMEIARDRDRVDSALFRLQKQYDDLLIAYQSLVEHSMTRFQFPNVEHLFSEREDPPSEESFLTPTWEDREGSGHREVVP